MGQVQDSVATERERNPQKHVRLTTNMICSLCTLNHWRCNSICI